MFRCETFAAPVFCPPQVSAVTELELEEGVQTMRALS